MKAEELMIGDWALFHDSGLASDDTKWYEDRTCQVIGILDNPYLKWINDGTPEYWSHASFDDLEPIPLTAEILKKNGFCKDINRGIFLYEKHMFMCYDIAEYEPFTSTLTLQIQRADPCTEDTNTSSYSLRSMFKINYVHELQHALRLCDINKEITL